VDVAQKKPAQRAATIKAAPASRGPAPISNSRREELERPLMRGAPVTPAASPPACVLRACSCVCHSGCFCRLWSKARCY